MTAEITLSVEAERTALGLGDSSLVAVASVRVPSVVTRASHRVVLAIDRSSSMKGRPLSDAIACAKALIDALRDDDEVAVVLFDANVDVALPPTPLNVDGRRRVDALLTSVTAGWGTDLHRALVQSAEVGSAANRATRIVVLSDGHPYVGEVCSARIIETVRNAGRAPHMSLATIGLGAHTDRLLLRALAQVGGGRFTHVADGASIAEAIGSELAVIDGTAFCGASAELVVTPAVARGEWIDRAPSYSTKRGVVLELPPLIAGPPLELAIDLDLERRNVAEGQLLKLALVRITARRATDGALVVAEAPLRVQRSSVRGEAVPRVILAECRARAACLMHDASCDLEKSDAQLAAWLARQVGELHARARAAGVHQDVQLAAALAILSRAVDDLVVGSDAGRVALEVASDGVARGYDASPGARSPVDLGPYRSASQRDGMETIIRALAKSRR